MVSDKQIFFNQTPFNQTPMKEKPYNKREEKICSMVISH